jgi:hypothetical protein
MSVWMARSKDVVKPTPPPSIASESIITASHVQGTLQAVNDRKEIKNSDDHSIPRFTWWSHKGTNEWISYKFNETVSISEIDLYWFDDEARNGGCRIPESWKLFYKVEDDWKQVNPESKYMTSKDVLNHFVFESVNTNSLRLEVKLQEEYSGGLLEWIVK